MMNIHKYMMICSLSYLETSYSLPQDVRRDLLNDNADEEEGRSDTFHCKSCVLLNGPAKWDEGLLPSTIVFLEFRQSMNFMDVSAAFLSTENHVHCSAAVLPFSDCFGI